MNPLGLQLRKGLPLMEMPIPSKDQSSWAGYAVSRLVITRTDSGGNAFNASEVGGAGAAAAISNLYYPSPERTWTKTYQRWILSVSFDGMTVVFREFEVSFADSNSAGPTSVRSVITGKLVPSLRQKHYKLLTRT